MWRRVVLPGLLGGLAMVVWAFVVNGILGFKASIDMKQVPNERSVYELLKANITEPGRYVCNPALTDSERFPDGEPVFGIVYGGMGHEAAGSHALFDLALFFVIPILAAWMLSGADRVLSSYARKLLFFVAVGLLIGLSSRLTAFGIGGYPLADAMTLALHDVVLWAVVGSVMAWRIRPQMA